MGYLNGSPNSRVDGGASEDDGVMLDCQGRRSPKCMWENGYLIGLVCSATTSMYNSPDWIVR